jgi:uncharacterized RmlC-like cupin family protein
MLRVSKVEERLDQLPTRPAQRTHDDCVIIRTGHSHGSRSGVSGLSAGAKALGVRLILMPPGTRGMPHFHADHETALYIVSGETEVWHGEGLVRRSTVRAGDYLYIPPGAPHLAVNRGDVISIAVAARTDPADSDSSVVIELPRHLAGLLSLPVAQE